MLVRRLAIANIIMLALAILLLMVAFGRRIEPTDIELTATVVVLTNAPPFAILYDTQTASARIAATEQAATQISVAAPEAAIEITPSYSLSPNGTVAAFQTQVALLPTRPTYMPSTLTAIASMPRDSICFLILTAKISPERNAAIHQAFVEADMTIISANMYSIGGDCSQWQMNFDLSFYVDTNLSPDAITQELVSILTVLYPFMEPENEDVLLGTIGVLLVDRDGSFVDGIYLNANDVLALFEQNDNATEMLSELEALETPFAPFDYSNFDDILGRYMVNRNPEARQTQAAAETATYAPRADPLLLTATAIAAP